MWAILQSGLMDAERMQMGTGLWARRAATEVIPGSSVTHQESSTAWGQGCVHSGMQPSVQTNDFIFHKIQQKVSLPTMQLTYPRVSTERKKLRKLTVSTHLSHILSPGFFSTQVSSLLSLSLPEFFVTELMYDSCRKEKYYILDSRLINFPFYFLGRAVQLAGWCFPDQGLNSDPQQWKSGVLTTRLPGNSLNFPISRQGNWEKNSLACPTSDRHTEAESMVCIQRVDSLSSSVSLWD